MQSPIIKRILIFGILSGLISLLLACLGFGIVEFYKIKNESIAKIDSQMDILAYNLEPTLLFDDKDAAHKILLSLEDDQSINRVVLYRANWSKFAWFGRPKRKTDIKLMRNVTYDQKVIGHLEIDSMYIGIREKYNAYLLISLLIMIISIPASYVISYPIRKQVSLGVIQLQQQSDRLRLLADQVVSTEQRERKRIAAIIHDHLQQLLVAAKLKLGLARREMDKGECDKAVLSLERVNNYINKAMDAAKTLTVELRPPVLYEDGLPAAFQWLANKFKNDHNLEILLKLDHLSTSLPDVLKIMIFESVRELLLNVVKYAGVDSAELSLKYEQGLMIVLVKDKGRGFDIQHFEKFSLEKSFGLFSIRERLKLINGDMKVSSQIGHGTEVQMTIPLSEVAKQPPNPVASPLVTRRDKQKEHKKVNILLVDDHKIVREGLANILNENGLLNVVAQAEDGVEAVEKAGIFHPDVIIMDINMPKLNGIEATRIIKNKFPKMEIIGLSVQDENDVIESMKKAGAVTLLNKAGDPHDLVRAILACNVSLSTY